MTLRTYYLETFGCQMNVLDSELVEGQFRALGMQPSADARRADVILFNTCSVRQHAEDKVLSRLGRLRAHKRRRPEVVLGVLGCMAERMKAELFEQASHLDLICGPGELHRLPALLEQVAQRRAPVAALSHSLSRRVAKAVRDFNDDGLEQLDLSRGSRPVADVLQAYIRVQRGCDKFCTYCVVPFTRGPERSRPPAHIVAEAQRLVEAGCREITLLGQTVNSYVHTEGARPVKLAELLERVHAVPGIDRIRFVTNFPADFDEDIFRAMRDLPKICPYLHIPAQSGSDRILKAMKRTYTAAGYLRLMDAARRHVPDIALAGDFIVGFCGETEADFQATVDLVRRVEYKNLFVFKYSPRPATAADRRQADDVPDTVKARRNNELLALQKEIGLRHKEALVGRTVDVLVEGYSKAAQKARARGDFAANGAQDRGDYRAKGAPARGDFAVRSEQERGSETGRPDVARQLVGRTPHDLITVFDGSRELIGSLVRIRVESASPLTLFGRLESVVSLPRRAERAPDAARTYALGITG